MNSKQIVGGIALTLTLLTLTACTVDGTATSDGQGPITTTTTTTTEDTPTTTTTTTSTPSVPLTGDPTKVRCQQFMTLSDDDRETVVKSLRSVPDGVATILAVGVELHCVRPANANRLVSDIMSDLANGVVPSG